MSHHPAALETCRGKQSFPDRASAMEVANWMWFHKARAVSAYRCPIGRHYHLTSMEHAVTYSPEAKGRNREGR